MSEEPVYGMCLACRSVEVRLNEQIGTPICDDCEVCS